jgi:hypothetical protein
MMREKNLDLFVLTVMIVIIMYGCHKKIDRDMGELYSKPIMVPYSKMEKRECSLYIDSVSENKKYRILNYIETLGCTDCELSRLAYIEKQNKKRYDLQDVEFVYIVNVPKNESEIVYSMFRDARIEGSVYLDTCHAFRRANPHIPDNPLFHTFVLNEQDSVVLIGDPFKNDKMESLFLKVIERERTKKSQ